MNSELPSYVSALLKAKSSDFALLIPVINEGDRIRAQLQRLRELSFPVDIYIVDGGSTDGSLDQSYLRQTGVSGLFTKTGAGRLSAQLRIGLWEILQLGYRGVVLIDGNNKDNPEAIPLFLQKLTEGFDHIQGSRFIPGGVEVNTPPSRKWGIKLLHAPLLSLFAGFRYTDTTNGFRAYSRKLLEHPEVQPFRGIFAGYELHYYLALRAAQLKLKVIEVPVERSYPSSGKVPTKIAGWRGNWLVLRTLMKACLGAFHPKGSR